MSNILTSGLQEITAAESNAWESAMADLASSLGKDNNLELKTDIPNPIAAAQLLTWARWAEKAGFVGAKKIVDDFLKSYMKYRVSHNRKGRIELVKAISATSERMRTTLTGQKRSEDGF